ncbi:hypothetical protein, partial [Nocardia abscessus]|uniref:hypothetical protein n=1 Tax=Nocardia abscessus TaxID=120957 RepID=UPI002453BAA7
MTTLPQFIGDLEYDRAALQAAAAECGRVLAELAPVAGRDDAPAAPAPQAHDTIRAHPRGVFGHRSYARLPPPPH